MWMHCVCPKYYTPKSSYDPDAALPLEPLDMLCRDTQAQVAFEEQK